MPIGVILDRFRFARTQRGHLIRGHRGFMSLTILQRRCARFDTALTALQRMDGRLGTAKEPDLEAVELLPDFWKY